MNKRTCRRWCTSLKNEDFNLKDEQRIRHLERPQNELVITIITNPIIARKFVDKCLKQTVHLLQPDIVTVYYFFKILIHLDQNYLKIVYYDST